MLRARNIAAGVLALACVPAAAQAATVSSTAHKPRITFVAGHGERNEVNVTRAGRRHIVFTDRNARVRAKGRCVRLGRHVARCPAPRSGRPLIDLGAGRDRLVVRRGVAVRARGGPGDDVLEGSRGRDLLRGGDGQDRIAGGGGPDLVEGGAGADRLHGGRDEDRVEGGSGDDRVWGDGGEDQMRGGYGNDRLNGEEGDGTFVIDGFLCDYGFDRAVPSGGDILDKCERAFVWGRKLTVAPDPRVENDDAVFRIWCYDQTDCRGQLAVSGDANGDASFDAPAQGAGGPATEVRVPLTRQTSGDRALLSVQFTESGGRGRSGGYQTWITQSQ